MVIMMTTNYTCSKIFRLHIYTYICIYIKPYYINMLNNDNDNKKLMTM